MSVPVPFAASEEFADVLKAAGLGELDMDAFRMLEEARLMVQEGEMDAEEYDRLVKGMHMQLLQLAAGGTVKALPAAAVHGKADVRPDKIEIPNEKSMVESYLMKLPVNSSSHGQGRFKKRYCVLYKTCILYFASKGDKVPKGRIDLNADFFVQDSSSHAHGFVLSDMTTTITLAAQTDELKGFWMHTCALVLRKLKDASAHDHAEDVQKLFEERLESFKKAKGSRRPSLFSRKKKESHDDVERQAIDDAVLQTTKELREREAQRQKELEELQRKLDLAEEEKNKYKTKAEHEEERANQEGQRAEEEAARRQDAEEKLEKTLEELRHEARAREEALLLEKEQIQEKLNEASIKRRESMMPGTADASESEKWEKERKALQAKLDALMDALHVDIGNLDWDGTLEDAEEKMKELVPALCSDDEKVAREAQAKFDQYDKVVRNHGDYKKREEQKWATWEEENAPKNKKALEDMKKIVPHEVVSGISMEFLKDQCHLSHDVAARIMKTKILQFLYMDPETIAKTHIADLSSRYVPQGLDIRELRAIYSCLPAQFELDTDGRKKLWRDDCRAKLHAMTEKEKNGNLPKNETLSLAYRPKEEKKAPVAAAGGGGGGGRGRANPMAGALNDLFAGRGGGGGRGGPPKAKLDTSALQNALSAKLAGGPKPPNAMVQKSAEMASKEEKKKETSDLLTMIKNTNGHAASEAAPEAAPAPASAPPADLKAPPPGQAVPDHLMDGKTKDLFAQATARTRTVTGDEFEGDVPAYDFEANYNAASKRKTWVDDGISKLVKLIQDHGTPDPQEGGRVTATFGTLFDNFGPGSDMLVGILMRARKKERIKYVGDMLFKGVHDEVKISII